MILSVKLKASHSNSSNICHHTKSQAENRFYFDGKSCHFIF